jgi:hypothetical protein
MYATESIGGIIGKVMKLLYHLAPHCSSRNECHLFSDTTLTLTAPQLERCPSKKSRTLSHLKLMIDH